MATRIGVGIMGLAIGLFGTSLSACGQDTETLQSDFAVALEPINETLEDPWSVEQLPDGSFLVTEIARGVRHIGVDGTASDLLDGVPQAVVGGQGGYLDLALAPDFADTGTVFLAFSGGSAGETHTAVMRGTLSDDRSAIEDAEIIFRSTPRSTTFHYGTRIAFMDDGTLLVGLGEGYRYMDRSQSTDDYHGTIVRIAADGSIPEDNPFTDGGAPAVWSYGHRNVQGLVVAADGTVYAHEHGPKGGDEINIIEAGVNYGWPEISYGIDYDGTIITDKTEMEGMAQPIVKWVPSIAPCGLALYTGDRYPGWTGDLFVGAMNGPAGQKLVRVDLEDGEVVGQEDLLADLGRPIRDVIAGHDGWLYVVTKELDGGLYRVRLDG